jgi:hypothetical protein
MKLPSGACFDHFWLIESGYLLIDCLIEQVMPEAFCPEMNRSPLFVMYSYIVGLNSSR